MKQYLELCNKILEKGIHKGPARENMPGTLSINSEMYKYDLSEGFPLLTTKHMYTRGIFVELMWLLMGGSHLDYLIKNKANFWNQDTYRWFKKTNPEAAKELDTLEKYIQFLKDNPNHQYGWMGKIYGYQWRNRSSRDQIDYVLHQIHTNPDSRYHIIECWNVDDIANNRMCLPPCHKNFHFFTRGEYLDMNFYVRSNDIPLGNPFNVPTYATLLTMFADILGYKPGILTYFGGDIHIYDNQIETLKEQIKREPFPLPKLRINYPVPIEDYWVKDTNGNREHFQLDKFLNYLSRECEMIGFNGVFEVKDYKHHGKLEFPLSTGL